MTENLFTHYKIPENYLNVKTDVKNESSSGFFRVGAEAICYGRISDQVEINLKGLDDADQAENLESAYRFKEGSVHIPFDLDEVIDNLRLERYIDNSVSTQELSAKKIFIRNVYYLVRPLFPVSFRRHLQKFFLRGWQDKAFPQWPVDSSVEHTFESVLKFALKEGGVDYIPFIWFWPKGHEACAIMTHDVETKEGLDFCNKLMDMTDQYQIKSAFELIPEVRYEVTNTVIENIKERGFEVCIHGLNHDGNLFKSKDIFYQRAKKINEYAEKYGAIGFRSPVMYRNLEWYDQYQFKYDLSVPNVGHLDPQPGGCCTVMPYYIGKLLELPLTTIQDYPLYFNLNKYNLDIWKNQAELIMKKNGLISFIIHPDYTLSEKSQSNYTALLQYLAELRKQKNLWIALPKEVCSWWNLRNNMRIEQIKGKWEITGEGSEKAALAFMVLESNELKFSFEEKIQQKV